MINKFRNKSVSHLDIERKYLLDLNEDYDYYEKQHSIFDLVNDKFFTFDKNNIPDYYAIKECVESRAKVRFGDNFQFRNNQCDSIISIISGFFTKENFIIEAPTGSGKSIIALLVADVLQYYFGCRGYILISDLSLLDQYTRDVDTYFSDFKFFKGQDNYECLENGLTFPFGSCRLDNMSYKQIETAYPCAVNCPYMCARREAIKANVTLMTYQAWLIQRNYIPMHMSNSEGDYPFWQREFTICDEAHKLAEIIQDHFTPIISKNNPERFESILKDAKKYIKKDIPISDNIIRKIIEDIFIEDDAAKLHKLLSDLHTKIEMYSIAADECKKVAKKMKDNDKKLPKDLIRLLYECDFCREYCCKIEDYVNMINETGLWALVKNYDGNETIKFNCIDERYLLREHFHKRCGNKLYMSATIGEPINYINSISSVNNRYINIPSSFDFTKSPIYYDNEYKLSYDKKLENLPKVISKIIKIIDNHPNMRGIIQTGSYAFAESLIMSLPNHLKDRVLMYSDSKDKETQLSDYKSSKDKVLIGPSLLEGIDLKDDLCRFIIVMKIPYPSLGDKFVEKKFKSNPQWYMWKTVNSLIQGIGRGVRNEKDWCETFILDATLDNILLRHRNLIPNHILNRIQRIKIE